MNPPPKTSRFWGGVCFFDFKNWSRSRTLTIRCAFDSFRLSGSFDGHGIIIQDILTDLERLKAWFSTQNVEISTELASSIPTNFTVSDKVPFRHRFEIWNFTFWCAFNSSRLTGSFDGYGIIIRGILTDLGRCETWFSTQIVELSYNRQKAYFHRQIL